LTIASNATTAPMPDLTVQAVVSDVNGGVIKTQSIASGTPLTAGTYTVTLTAIDSLHLSTSTAVTVTVTSPVPPQICTGDSVRLQMQKTPAGSDLWLSSVFRLKGSVNPAVNSHLYVTGAVVTFGSTKVKLPDAVITFAPD